MAVKGWGSRSHAGRGGGAPDGMLTGEASEEVEEMAGVLGGITGDHRLMMAEFIRALSAPEMVSERMRRQKGEVIEEEVCCLHVST